MCCIIYCSIILVAENGIVRYSLTCTIVIGIMQRFSIRVTFISLNKSD